MKIIDRETGTVHEGKIELVTGTELISLNETGRFDFDWNEERTYTVYKLTANSEVQGLMSLNDRPEDLAVEIRLLAVSYDNIGSNKKYTNVAGCLIAFACREAFKKGYFGYVCLKPKTELKIHYREIYGMMNTKLYMVTEGHNSLELIKKYLEL